ncbi:MAG: lysophospholipid acyltransferase family protein [Eubacteriales bacterium]|nr:lysophospholipid acyltransferase family protein [Eubacteriales bacterium]
MVRIRRHIYFYGIMRWLLNWPISRLLRFQTAGAPAVEGPYIVVSNHNTDYDSLLLGISFPRHMYFVASEHIFRTGWLRRLLIYFIDPIPKRKGGADVSTAMQMVRRLRRGNNIALFAEGNKSFDGATCPVHPATGSMVKASGASLITYRLEGGYLTSPRWSHTLRRGRMRGGAVNVYSPKILSGMRETEINRLIARDIDEDAYLRQEENPVAFKGKKLAEGIQNALYLCPRCHAFGTVTGENDQVVCGCGLRATYTETGYLKGEQLPFATMEEWGRWQRAYLKGKLLTGPDEAVFSDEGQAVLHIFLDHHTEKVAEGTLSMGRSGLRCGAFRLPADKLEGLEIYGRNTIVFSDGEGNRYQVLSATERSGLKYFDAFEILRKEKE